MSGGSREFRFSPRPNKANQIRWRHWGEEAFEEARDKDVLVLLSISAVWCHWCHVMDETSYSEEDIISFINDNYIPVRVDADMRPDVDSLYNQGGWPTTAILTPVGDIFEGGTYIPPEQMLQKLKFAREIYATKKEEIEGAIAKIRAQRDSVKEVAEGEPGIDDIRRVAGMAASAFDPEHGGFGSPQKFPNTDIIDFLMSEYWRGGDSRIRDVVVKTLDSMMSGDLFDKVEGGFFRYSTRPDWSEPHYEKMLEGNASLIVSYANAYRLFGDERYMETVSKTFAYLMDMLYDPATGCFRGSQDADEEYYKTEDRSGLEPPFVDNTIYADTASRMAGALAIASQAAGDARFLEASETAARFMLDSMYESGQGISHYYSAGKAHLPDMLSDNVNFATCLLDLYETSGDGRHLEQASALAGFILKRFYDMGQGRFSPAVTTGVRPALDASMHGFGLFISNARAALLFSRLGLTTETGEYSAIARKVLQSLRGEYENYAIVAPLYAQAIRWSGSRVFQLRVVSSEQALPGLLNSINSIYIPERTVRVYQYPRDAAALRVAGYPEEDAVYICRGEKCYAPVRDMGSIKAEVERIRKEE